MLINYHKSKIKFRKTKKFLRKKLFLKKINFLFTYNLFKLC
jgi:hypothetical protein